MTIKIDLADIDSIDKAVKLMDEAVEIGIANGLKELSELIEQKLVENIRKYHIINTGRLLDSISVIPTQTGFIISCGVEYAMFVEYGTGIVGAENPHPSPDIDWIYDSNYHGEAGWWYPTTSDDPNPAKRVTKDGTILAWTAGQRSKPFMYDTWLWARRSASQIIKKHIGRALSGS